MLRKLIFISLSCLLMFSLLVISCSSKNQLSTSSSTLQTSTVESEKPQWEKEWEKILNGAKKEGKVTIYSTSGGELRAVVVKAMKDNYGLDVEWTSGRGAEVSQKLFAERRAGINIADIYLGGNTTIINELKPAGFLEPPGSKLLLPEVTALKAWYGDNGPVYLDDDKLVLAVSVYPSGDFAVNTNLVKEGEVASYPDMLNIKWKGKIVISDPTVAGSGLGWFTFVAFGLNNMDFVRALVKNEPAVLRDHRQLVEWLSQGKFAIALATKPEVVTSFQQAGAPLKSLYPKEGGYLSSGGGNVALINRAPHPNAALIFLNWILTREGETLYSTTMGVQSGRQDIPTNHLDPGQVRQEGVKYANHMKEDFLKLRPQHAKIAEELFGPLMK